MNVEKIKILWRVAVGYWQKLLIDITGLSNRLKITPDNCNKEVIVSLTSYGRRVNSTVYYTLVSLLRQTIKPYKIILNLDEKNWDELKLPKKLKKICKYGVEINYCKDLKSYTKLIPTLINYPNYTIITVDDDMIYRGDMIEKLLSCQMHNPNAICCNIASAPIIDECGAIRPYQEWKEPVFNSSEKILMPWGVWGVLYPPHSLHKDVTDTELFSKLCPNADDVWFWLMGELKGTPKAMVDLGCKRTAYAFDDLYQYFHKGSALTHVNDHENKNDVQIKNVIKNYNIKFAKQ